MAVVQYQVGRSIKMNFPWENVAQLVHVLLKDPDIDQRRNAAIVLCQEKDVSLIDPLIEALVDHEDVVIFVMLTLVEIGAPAIPSLIAALRSPHEQVRGYSAEILGEIRAQEAVDDLILVIEKDESIWVKNAAVSAIQRFKCDKTIETLKNLLDNEDNWLFVSASVALHRNGINPEHMVERMLDRLSNQCESEQHMTAWALVEVAGKSDIEVIQNRMRSTKEAGLIHILSEVVRGISSR